MRLCPGLHVPLQTLTAGGGLFPATSDVGQAAAGFDLGRTRFSHSSARLGEPGFQLAFLLAAVRRGDQGEVLIDDGKL